MKNPQNNTRTGFLWCVSFHFGDGMNRQTGPPEEKRLLKVKSADVFLTSYGVFRADAKKLACPNAFAGMILDEAQQIKNYNSQISKAVKQAGSKRFTSFKMSREFLKNLSFWV